MLFMNRYVVTFNDGSKVEIQAADTSAARRIAERMNPELEVFRVTKTTGWEGQRA